MQAKPMLINNHFSSREGGRVHLAVLHTTEGEGTLESLKSLFENEEASSHYASDPHGRIAQYVKDQFKAWTECNFNPVSLSLEQIAFAAFTRTTWFMERHDQLKAAAKFLVYCHIHHGVPIRKGEVSGGGIVRDGVVQHKDLGLIGCGHSDCGDGYPQEYVMLLARYYIAHMLHEDSPFTKRLRNEVNAIRGHYGVKKIR
jgi:hypothetical protein